MKAILIATGDEITQGDILNTTGPAIARQLAEHNIAIIKHVMVPDQELAIQETISEALTKADMVFITGGLGPTSDDLTRFALAKALHKKLIFDEDSWQAIVSRLMAYKLHVHEDNKRQAYFPEGAEIFPNPNGTARGCRISHNSCNIFMLPGPPNECLPMFENYILPTLPQIQPHKLHWLLLGASEGEIASMIDKALTHLPCQTGYRFDYPYLEIKVWCENAADLIEVEKIVEPLVKQYLVSKENKYASQLLQENIIASKQVYNIHDMVTGGALQNILVSPQTLAQLTFLDSADTADIAITGLNEFWQGLPAPRHTTVQLRYFDKIVEQKLYYRNATIKNFVAEWVCWQIVSSQQ